MNSGQPANARRGRTPITRAISRELMNLAHYGYAKTVCLAKVKPVTQFCESH